MIFIFKQFGRFVCRVVGGGSPSKTLITLASASPPFSNAYVSRLHHYHQRNFFVSVSREETVIERFWGFRSISIRYADCPGCSCGIWITGHIGFYAHKNRRELEPTHNISEVALCSLLHHIHTSHWSKPFSEPQKKRSVRTENKRNGDPKFLIWTGIHMTDSLGLQLPVHTYDGET